MNESTMRSGVRPLALAVALALGAGAAQAATITVTTGGDAAGTTSTCTLRQAIVAANTDDATGSACAAGSGADTINFDTSLANSTITLASGELDVLADLTLVGSGQTIDAAGASRVLNGGYDSINHTDTPVNLAVSNLTISGGAAANDSGGGVYISQYSNLSLSHVTVSGNSAKWGSGIYGWGDNTISIADSTISGNTSSSIGGGVYVFVSTLTVSNSTISGNSAAYYGGGIMVQSSPGTVTVTNSTLTGNTAYNGGGIYIASGNAVTIADSTVSGNTATAAGGGILVGSDYTTLALDNDIVSANMSADTPSHDLGVAVRGGGEGPASRPDKRGGTVGRPMAASTITPQFTLLGASLQATYAGNGNVFSDNPGLGALANNGGPTWTMALQPGSPAIDVGNNALVPAGTTADQRGIGFARVFNGTVDMGAYEVQGSGTAIPQYVPVPVRAPWALGLLAMLLGFVGVRQYRRRREA